MNEVKKGFRTPPKPTKGEVAKENESLSNLVVTRLNFLNQQVLGLMRKAQQLETETGALSELLGYETSTKPLAEGDKALISYMGRMVNEDGTVGKLFQGGFSRLTIIGLGSNQFIPGFEEAVTGMVAGDKKTFEVTFPKEYGHPALANQKASFTVKVFKTYSPVAGLFELEDEYLALAEAQMAADKAEADKKAAEETPKTDEAPKA